MVASLLVANRAEIACRIFRTARSMGIRCIGVHSEADAKGKHVREADQSVLIGPAPASESYLRGDRIIEAARRTGADAIHPGYGFLSENPDFAEAVIAAGLIWVGPSPASIRAMGLKDEAKRIAEEAGVPVVPGYRGEAQDAKALGKAAKEIGFPVLIKAVAGGGGRGIREVHAPGQFGEALASARREAAAAFGDDRVIIEKLIERPRHIEVQVFGDKHGALVHMYERDCSLQRRRQKVIEEAPAPGMTEEVRAAMTDAALKVARSVNYENAGTVEFIVDGSRPLRADGFWFLEMNTRLQVEHPVTEVVTGLDLVEWQLRIAAGEKLPRKQREILLAGHAIEARLCAEDPSESFRPSVGRIRLFDWTNVKSSVRLDDGFDCGDAVPSSYDSLLAKVIAQGPDRAEAIHILSSALQYFMIRGVRTNAYFLKRCLGADEFIAGRHHVGLIAEHLDGLTDRSRVFLGVATVAALVDMQDRWHEIAWEGSDGWRLNAQPRLIWSLSVDDHPQELILQPTSQQSYLRHDGVRVSVLSFVPPFDNEAGDIQFKLNDDQRDIEFVRSGQSLFVFADGDVFEVLPSGAAREHADGAAGDEVKAPLPGKVVAIAARAGLSVKKGDPLITLEAMKMEHALRAPRDGIVAEIAVKAGAQVKEGALLVRLEEEAE